ncbi:MAG: DNA adenine methylase, partial [Helicobacteraceae bacterium]|nr:DNA adenine methylase [Helicobacteraceae bacterium]
KLIREYDSPDSFFYVDPPYYGTEDYYEGKHFGKSDHERLRDVLANAKGKWLLSYNDCEAIRELYGGFAIDSLSARYTFGSSNGRIAEELLIANY